MDHINKQLMHLLKHINYNLNSLIHLYYFSVEDDIWH